MSQISVFGTAGGGGGGSVLTLTGNTGGAVGPTAGNINVVGDNTTVTVAGNPGTSTLVISIPNTTFYTAQTVGATPVTVVAVPVPNNTAAAVFIKGIAARSDFSLSFGYEAVSAAQTALGITVVSGPPGGITSSNASVATIVCTASGNTLLVQVEGEAGETWNWSLYIQVLTQT